MKTYEQPTVTQREGTPDFVEQHPAYGCITVNRVSGQTQLFGSEFTHHNYIAISIRTADLERSSSRDWHFPKKELVEVCMSEAQWATFISSTGIGSGSPCTINHFNGQSVPGIQRVKKTRDKFTGELDEVLDDIRRDLKAIRGQICSAKITKKERESLLGILSRVDRGLSGNLDFIANQFREHIEKTVEDAKIEVEAHTESQIIKAGLDAIRHPMLTIDK